MQKELLKIKILTALGLIVLLSIACDNEPVDYSPVQISKKLSKWIENEHYTLSSSTHKNTSIFIVKNDRIAEYTFIPPGNISTKHEFSYLDNRLIKETIYHLNADRHFEVSYSYDDSNRLIEKVSWEVNTSYYKKWIYDYTQNEISVKFYKSNNGIDYISENNQVEHFMFDEDDKLIKLKVIGDNNHHVEFYYDDKDNLSSMQFYFSEKNVADDQITYVHNEHSNPLREIFVNTFGKRHFQMQENHLLIQRNMSPNAVTSIERRTVNSYDENFKVSHLFNQSGVLEKIEMHISYGFPIEQGQHITELFYD